MRAIVEEPPPSVRAVRPDVPQALDAIVRKALAKSPDDRYATAGDMQDALEAHLATTRSLASARIVAPLVQSLFEKEIAEGPALDRRRDVTGAFVIPSLRPPSLEAPVTEAAEREPEQAGSRLSESLRDRATWVIAAAAIGLLALVAIVAALATDSDETEPTEPEASAPAAPDPEPGLEPPEPEPAAEIVAPVMVEPEPEPEVAEPEAVTEPETVTEPEPEPEPEAAPAPVRRPPIKRAPRGAAMTSGPVFVRDPGF